MLATAPKALFFSALVLAIGLTVPAAAQLSTDDWQPNYPSTPPPRVGKGVFAVAIADPASKILQQRNLETMTIALRTAAGKPVTDATIAVAARTREIDRRMQTDPRVTRNLGGGKYLIEGLRFDMAGLWLLEFEIAAGGARDRTLLQVDVE